MKLAAFISGITLATAVSGANVHVRASENLIEVGDLDIFEHTWKAIYAAAGNKEAVNIDTSVQTQNKRCHYNNKADHSVRVQISGKWDDVNGNKHEIRDAMVEAAWESLRRIGDNNWSPIWKGCCDGPVTNTCPSPRPAGWCGARSGVACGCEGNPAGICMRQTRGHKIPSSIQVSVNRNGIVTGNELTIQFSGAPIAKAGCGVVEAVVKGLASFVFPPAVNTIVGTGIDIQCSL